MACRAHYRGVAEARRCADHDVARSHQSQMRRKRRSGHAVEHRDIVPVGRPAEMLQRQCLQPLEIERRRNLVIGKAQLLAAYRQRMLEPGKYEYGIWAALADQGSGAL